MAVKRETKFVYDANLKKAYLKELESEGYSLSQYNVAVSFLNRVSCYERTMKMPCNKFSTDVLLDLLGTVNSTSISTLKTFLSTLRCYIVFVNDLENTPHLNTAVMNIDSSDLLPLINPLSKSDKYITEEEYKEIISIKTRDMNWLDLAAVVLLWNGVKGKGYNDLVNIRREHFVSEQFIQMENQIVTLNKRERLILRKGFNSQSYCYYDRYNSDGSVRNVKLVDSDYLFKGTLHVNSCTSRISVSTLKCRVAAFTNIRLGLPSLTGGSIYASGVVYRAMKKNKLNKVSTIELDRMINPANKERIIAYSKIREIQNTLFEKLERG